MKHIAPFDYAVVGSNENQVGGHVYLVRVTAQGAITLLDTAEVEGPVYAVALSTALLPNRLTVLVGSACVGTDGSGCGSLRRYDVDYLAAQPTFGPSTGLWPSLPCLQPTAVRDIVIREGEQRAYVAAFARGIRKFNLSTGGLVEESSGGFPIVTTSLYNGLAIHEGENLLVASLGAEISSEYQYWGGLNTPESCYDTGTPQGMGVALIDLATGVQLGSLGVNVGRTDFLQKPPLAVSVRPRDAGGFLIDVASGTKGLAVVRATESGGQWTLERTGWWSTENAPPSEKAPGGSFDSVRIKGNYLYAGTEGTLLTFSDAPAGAPLLDYTGISTAGCVLVNGESPTAVGAPMLYTLGQTNGVRFFDLEHPANPQASIGFLDTDGRGYSTFLTRGMNTQQFHWLYVANDEDESTAAVGCTPSIGCPAFCCDRDDPDVQSGGIRVYEVENAGGFITEPSSMVRLRGVYAPSACCHSAALQFRPIDVLVVDQSATTQIVWVSYHRGPHTTDCGLLVLQGTWNATTQKVDFVQLARMPFADQNVAGECGRLTYDESALPPRLYASYASHGFAMYNVSSPSMPVEMGRFQLGTEQNPWLAENTLTSLQVWPGPGNYVYVSLLNWGVGILDATNGTTFAQGFKLGSPFEMTFIPNAFYDAPEDAGKPARSAVYIADGSGGIHRVQFNVF